MMTDRAVYAFTHQFISRIQWCLRIHHQKFLRLTRTSRWQAALLSDSANTKLTPCYYAGWCSFIYRNWREISLGTTLSEYKYITSFLLRVATSSVWLCPKGQLQARAERTILSPIRMTSKYFNGCRDIRAVVCSVQTLKGRNHFFRQASRVDNTVMEHDNLLGNGYVNTA
jgi:hypothetical protein